MYVRVHVFGSGPRSRRIASALVRDALPTSLVRAFDDVRSAALAARGSSMPVVLLDARVAVDPEPFRKLCAADGTVATRARSFDGSLARSVAALRFPDGVSTDETAGNAAREVAPVGAWLEEPEPLPDRRSGQGVDFHGYGKGPSGFATASRNLMIGLERAGVDVNWLHWVREFGDAEIVPQDRAMLERIESDRVRNDRAVVFHPPTHTSGQEFLDTYGRAYVRVPFACATMFETDTIPAQWAQTIARCSRLWVPSAFNVETFAAGGVPREMIDLVPIGLDIENQPIDGPALHLPERRSVAFVSVFEWTFRKGWDVLFGAWAAAFNRDDDVCLIVRTSFRELDIEATIRQYLTLCGFDVTKIAPIIVLPKKISQAQLVALYRSADAYVLPTRGEGFGLPYLEAMALGLPAIGTGWSGMTDFVDERTGYLIDARLAPITSPTITRIVPIYKDQRWAEPSPTSTAAQMRRVYEHRDEAELIAARGTVVARTQFNRTRIGRIAAEALSRVEPRKRTVRAPASSGRVRFDANLYALDGAGADARGLLSALDARRFGCQVSEDGDRTWIGLIDRADAALIHAGLADRAGGDVPTIVSVSPKRLGTLAGTGSAIARTVATRATLEPRFIDRLRRFDEIWVPSQFSADRFAAAGVDPQRLAVVPQGIDVEHWVPQIGGLEIAPKATTLRLLTVIDWDQHSGWDIAVQAFLRAFAPTDDVLLVLKVCARDPSAPMPNYPNDVGALVKRAMPDKLATLGSYPIDLITGMSPMVDLIQYYGSFDALICSAREIGWGRPLLEAMACGAAVVAPRFGNHRAFTTADNAFLFDAKPTTEPTVFEPDVEALAHTLRGLYEHRAEFSARAHLARHMVRAQHALEVAGAAAAARLDRTIERAHRPAPTVTQSFPQRPPRLGVVVDARFEPQHLERALDLLERMTRSDFTSVVVGPKASSSGDDRGRAASLGEAFARLSERPYVAYLRSDAVVSGSWDDFLIDALRARPHVAFAVPRTFNVPGPQGELDPGDYDVESPAIFATFARFVSTTHSGHGTTLDTFSSFCIAFERAVLTEALERTGSSFDSVDELARAAITGGRRPWCAQDAIVAHSGSAGRSMVELRVPART